MKFPQTLTEEIDSVRRDLAATSQRLEAILAEAETQAQNRGSLLESALQEAQRNLTDLRNELQAAQDQFTPLIALKKWLVMKTENAESFKGQLKAVIDNARTLPKKVLHPQVHDPLKYFEEQGFFFDADVLKNCIQALESGDPLLILGPVGVGKTTLAEGLRHIFATESETVTMDSHVADSSWTETDVHGAKFIEGDELIPLLGHFTNAVITAVDSHGHHWLFIDELNHCDVDRVFGPLTGTLAKLPQGNATLPIPLIGELRVPSTFRLICAMNDTDGQRLFFVPPHFLSRFRTVRLDIPKPETERLIIESLLRQKDNGFGLTGRVLEGDRRQKVADAIERFVLEVARIREAFAGMGAQQCSPDIRDTRRVFNEFNLEDLPDTAAWLDAVILNHFVPRLKLAPGGIAADLVGTWRGESRFPRSRAALERTCGPGMAI
jgi:energy-coupling factor transporter ATP-binding protein EcfA2